MFAALKCALWKDDRKTNESLSEKRRVWDREKGKRGVWGGG